MNYYGQFPIPLFKKIFKVVIQGGLFYNRLKKFMN